MATQALCGSSALEAARLCDTTLENLPANAEQPAYEIWRQRIQRHFQETDEKRQRTGALQNLAASGTHAIS